MMLIFLALLYFSLGSIRAAPLDIFGQLDIFRPPDLLQRDCECPPNQRTIFTIVWNCIVTITLCTWSSVHPNIPGPDEGQWEVIWQRIELMLWGLIAPEFILVWALRQWRGARYIRQKVHGEPV
jgi:hypothetical protein